MVEAVFRQAFPDVGKDEFVNSNRKAVIHERLGLRPEPTKKDRQDFLRDLSKFRFDKSMIRILSRERTPAELQLFLAHSLDVFRQDDARASDVPRNLGQNPALDGTLLAGTFNRANRMLDEDLQMIDQTVEAVTGKPHLSGGNRAR